MKKNSSNYETKKPIIGLKRVNSFKLIEHLLNNTQKTADLYICSFSLTEEWLQRIILLKNKRPIGKIVVILDKAILMRHREKIAMLKRVVDVIGLSDSHAKMYMVIADDYQGAILTSANATNNYRIETVYETTRPDEIETFKSDIQSILDRAKIFYGDGTD